MHAARLQRPFPAVLRQHFGGLLEKRAVRVQTNRGIAAGVLAGTGDGGMLENLILPDFFFSKDVARPVFFQHEIHRSKRARGVRIGFLEPGGTAIFGLEYFQNLIPGSGNCFSLLAQGKQSPLNSLVLAAESRNRRADVSARIILRIARSALGIGRSHEVEPLTRRFDFHFRAAIAGASLRAGFILRHPEYLRRAGALRVRSVPKVQDKKKRPRCPRHISPRQPWCSPARTAHSPQPLQESFRVTTNPMPPDKRMTRNSGSMVIRKTPSENISKFSQLTFKTDLSGWLKTCFSLSANLIRLCNSAGPRAYFEPTCLRRYPHRAGEDRSRARIHAGGSRPAQ